jgi:hypothetical protein
MVCPQGWTLSPSGEQSVLFTQKNGGANREYHLYGTKLTPGGQLRPRGSKFAHRCEFKNWPLVLDEKKFFRSFRMLFSSISNDFFRSIQMLFSSISNDFFRSFRMTFLDHFEGFFRSFRMTFWDHFECFLKSFRMLFWASFRITF